VIERSWDRGVAQGGARSVRISSSGAHTGRVGAVLGRIDDRRRNLGRDEYERWLDDVSRARDSRCRIRRRDRAGLHVGHPCALLARGLGSGESGLWHETHPWGETYDGTGAGLIHYSAITINLYTVGDQRTLDVRFPIVTESPFYRGYGRAGLLDEPSRVRTADVGRGDRQSAGGGPSSGGPTSRVRPDGAATARVGCKRRPRLPGIAPRRYPQRRFSEAHGAGHGGHGAPA